VPLEVEAAIHEREDVNILGNVELWELGFPEMRFRRYIEGGWGVGMTLSVGKCVS